MVVGVIPIISKPGYGTKLAQQIETSEQYLIPFS